MIEDQDDKIDSIMPGNKANNNKPAGDLPAWSGYFASLISRILLSMLLIIVNPFLPLSGFPVFYALPVIGISYYFGTGPGIFSLLFAIINFVCFFILSKNPIWPNLTSQEESAAVMALAVGSLLGLGAALMMRFSKQHAEKLKNEAETEHRRLLAVLDALPVGSFL